MIVRANKGYETNTAFPKTNWYENEPDNLVVDETTPEGQALANKIKQYAPYMDLVIADGQLVDVTPTERPPEPVPPPTEEEQIQLLDERTSGMQSIDDFTLQQQTTTNERTEGMQEIDDYTLQLVNDLQQQVTQLQADINTLKGGA